MNKNINKERWQQAYEPAPASFRRAMARALDQTKEEPNMRRFTRRAAALTVAILLALAGAAVAVNQSTGVLDFLFGSDAPKPDLPLQTGLPQINANAMGTVSVKVRDAVSDGISLHMAVAFTVKDPKDAILIDYDEPYLYDPGMEMYRELPVSEEGQGQNPFATQAKHANRCLILGTTMANYDGFDLVSDVKWTYEAPGVLVIDYVIDLRESTYRTWASKPSFPLPDPLKLVLTPTLWVLDGKDVYAAGYKHKTLEQGAIEVTVICNDLGQRRYVAANLPYEGEDYRVEDATFIATPLAVYATYRVVDTGEFPGMESTSPLNAGGLYFDLEDENGEALLLRNAHLLPETDEAISFRAEHYYPAHALGDALTVRPRAYVFDEEKQDWDTVYLNPFTLKLKEESR